MRERKKAHHNAGRAKTALRAVVLHHRALHLMKLTLRGEIFNRDDIRTIGLA